jgi:hypothetical protein
MLKLLIPSSHFFSHLLWKTEKRRELKVSEGEVWGKFQESERKEIGKPWLGLLLLLLGLLFMIRITAAWAELSSFALLGK